jgi:hypothetical protein
LKAVNKKTRVFERACIVAKKGAICPIFEGDMPPKKYTPKRWPFIDGHSMKAVKRYPSIQKAKNETTRTYRHKRKNPFR